VLEKSVTTLYKYLENLEFKPWAIVIADNGSCDETPNIGKKLALKFPGEIYYFRASKKGRGVALKEVVSNYNADVYTYFDIDLPLREADITDFVSSVKNNYTDIQIVKRKGTRPFYRNLMTWLYKFLTKVLLDIEFKDSQCGAKCFNKSVATSVFPKCAQNGYYFDTEFVSLAHKNQFRIDEKEFLWLENRFIERKSKINIFRDSLNAFINIFKIALFVNKVPSFHSLLLLIASVIYALIFYKLIYSFPIFAIKEIPLLPDLKVIYPVISFALWSAVYFFILKIVNLRYLDKLIIYTTFGIVALLALLTFPVCSQDQSWNLLMSKGFVRYGINPYLTTLEKIPANSWFSFINVWGNFVMTHGPLSVYIFSIPVLLFDNFYYALLFLKLISLSSLIVCFVLHSKIMFLMGVRDTVASKNTCFFLLNPFLIINTVLTVHNDIFIALTVLLFTLLLLQRRYILSSLMLFVGALVKYIPLILIPLLLYKIWTDRRLTLYKKTWNSAVGLLLGGALSFILYLPFLKGIKNVTSLFSGLRAQYTFDAFPDMSVFTSFMLYKLGLYGSYLRTISLVSATILSIYLAYKKKILESVYVPLLIPVFFGNLWFQPWYLLWCYFLLIKKEFSVYLLFLTIFLELNSIYSDVLRISFFVFCLFLYFTLFKYLIKLAKSVKMAHAHNPPLT
jgi:glycosyltransferase involved in cell wall biosynthesis